MSRPSLHAPQFTTLLEGFEQPFSARELLERIQNRKLTISRATTFRLLDQAVAERELVTVPHLGNERIYERVRAHHHHAVCPRCETVRDAEFDCTEHASSEAVLSLTICQQCAAQASA